MGDEEKPNGRYKARITTRGYAQRDGEHFDSSDKESPVVNGITILIVSTLIVMAGFWIEIVDVRGAFLTAKFDPSRRMCVCVSPKGFREIFS
jgi:hypothetical protein